MHVITNDRLSSLMRLVKSLQDSHFLGDEVQLSFHVDVDADGELMDYLMVSTFGGFREKGLFWSLKGLFSLSTKQRREVFWAGIILFAALKLLVCCP